MKGTWFSVTIGHDETAFRLALVSCPICGSEASLSGYAIDPEGLVTPVVRCAYACGFRRQVRLKGWGSIPDGTAHVCSPKEGA